MDIPTDARNALEPVRLLARQLLQIMIGPFFALPTFCRLRVAAGCRAFGSVQARLEVVHRLL